MGAGTMGANIALSFASHGQAVQLHDVDPAQLKKALQTIRTHAALLREYGMVTEPLEQVMGRITCVPRLEEAVDGADLVIEAVLEKIQLKQQVFTQLDRLCAPETVLASNTSTFAPSVMAFGLQHAERKQRFLVMHYWNPAHLMPLVELVPHPESLPSMVEEIRALLVRCGKAPVIVRKEIDGFIGNRLAFALQREAMALVEQGVATPEDIDTVAKTGFGRRIPVTGIFGTADLGGLDVYLEICRSLFPQLNADRTVPMQLKRRVGHGHLGVKTGCGWNAYTPEQIAALTDVLTRELIRQLQRDRGAVAADVARPPATFSD